MEVLRCVSEGKWQRVRLGKEMKDVCIYIYIYTYLPGTCLSSILGLQPPKRRPFPIKTGVIWVPGIHMECIFTTKMMLNDENGLNQWYIEGVVGF